MHEHDAPPIYGLVVAGGQSRRMGFDKASIQYHDEPEARRIYGLLRDLCGHAYVSVRRDQVDAELFEGLPLIADEVDGEGPIAGIVSAMQSYPDASWLVVGCDMPLLDCVALHRLIDGRDAGAAVTAYRASDGAVEPLCAIYEPICRKALSDAVSRGDFGLRRMLRDWDVTLVESEGDVTASANTPEESETMRAWVESMEFSPCR